MKKYLIILTLLISSITGCTKDWNITNSGLGKDQPSSSSPSQLDPGSGNQEIYIDNNQPNTDGQGSPLPSPRYDPSASPPKIVDPVMGSPWREFTNAPITNKAGERDADAYLAIILQFNVAKSYPCRYTNKCGELSDTRCNIFASDVMNAMGAPLPTKGDLGVGHGNSKYTDPMPANAKDTFAWLEKEKDGWRKLDPNNPSDWAELMDHLAAGKPALVSHPDHIAVLRPDQPSDLITGHVGDLHIAQAGAYNSNDTLVKTAFQDRTVGIYVHE